MPTSRPCSSAAPRVPPPVAAIASQPFPPECRVYLQEVARRRIDLESEIQKLGRLLQLYGPTDLAEGMKRALAAHTFGVRYVRALIDQSRFARGLGEPPEPIVTGNTTADEIVVEPHALETYSAPFGPVRLVRFTSSNA